MTNESTAWSSFSASCASADSVDADEPAVEDGDTSVTDSRAFTMDEGTPRESRASTKDWLSPSSAGELVVRIGNAVSVANDGDEVAEVPLFAREGTSDAMRTSAAEDAVEAA